MTEEEARGLRPNNFDQPVFVSVGRTRDGNLLTIFRAQKRPVRPDDIRAEMFTLEIHVHGPNIKMDRTNIRYEREEMGFGHHGQPINLDLWLGFIPVMSPLFTAEMNKIPVSERIDRVRR